MLSLITNWIIILIVGLLLGFYLESFPSFYAGIIGTVIGAAITYIVSLFIPTEDLIWALIAVSYASFFAGMFGYRNGKIKDEQNQMRT